MKIQRIEKLSRCPAAAQLAVEAVHYLHEQGLTEPTSCGANYTSRAVLASKDDWPVGIIVFSEQEWSNSLVIEIGYVVPEHRGEGIYTALWTDLVAFAREKGISRIMGTTHRENRRMQSMMENLGRELTWLGYEYRVPAEDNPCGC